MRITSGIYKGRNLLVPKNHIKPTTEMIRQAVINYVRPELNGANFLDLFCGTGAVGIEALSNGANIAYFVDKDFRTYKSLKMNLEKIVADSLKYHAIKHNAFQISTVLKPEDILFDIIFADPFYKDVKSGFDRLYESAYPLLANHGVFILEHGDDMNFSIYPGFKDTRKYGDTRLSFFHKENGGQE